VFLFYNYLCRSGHGGSQTSVDTRHEEVSRIFRTANGHVVALLYQVSSITILIRTVFLWDIHSEEDHISNNVQNWHS